MQYFFVDENDKFYRYGVNSLAKIELIPTPYISKLNLVKPPKVDYEIFNLPVEIRNDILFYLLKLLLQDNIFGYAKGLVMINKASLKSFYNMFYEDYDQQQFCTVVRRIQRIFTMLHDIRAFLRKADWYGGWLPLAEFSYANSAGLVIYPHDAVDFSPGPCYLNPEQVIADAKYARIHVGDSPRDLVYYDGYIQKGLWTVFDFYSPMLMLCFKKITAEGSSYMVEPTIDPNSWETMEQLCQYSFGNEFKFAFLKTSRRSHRRLGLNYSFTTLL